MILGGKDKGENVKFNYTEISWKNSKIKLIRAVIKSTSLGFVPCFILQPYNWKEYIILDKQILIRKPIIKGPRISLELVLELFSTGWNKK